jgi:hypothetical protein
MARASLEESFMSQCGFSRQEPGVSYDLVTVTWHCIHVSSRLNKNSSVLLFNSSSFGYKI